MLPLLARKLLGPEVTSRSSCPSQALNRSASTIRRRGDGEKTEAARLNCLRLLFTSPSRRLQSQLQVPHGAAQQGAQHCCGQQFGAQQVGCGQQLWHGAAQVLQPVLQHAGAQQLGAQQLE